MTSDRTGGRGLVALEGLGGVAAQWLCVLGMERLYLGVDESIVLPAYWIASLAVVAACVVWLARVAVRDVARELGFAASPVRGFLWGATLVLPLPLCFSLFGDFELVESSEFLRWVADRPFAFLDYTLFAGIVEESVYRGWLLRHLVVRGGMRPSIALPAQALVFGVAHARAVAALPPGEALSVLGLLTVGGFVMGALFVAFEWNLWVPVFWHAALNFWVLACPGLRVASGSTLLSAGVVLGLSAAVAAGRTRARRRRIPEDRGAEDPR